MKRIDPRDIKTSPFSILDREWALLVGGEGDRANPMTVSWGGMGTLWHRPVATVYVRPTRHTYGLLEEHREFTLNFMPPPFRAALETCGKVSGRDTDKWKAAGIEPQAAEEVSVPRVKGARLALECRVIGFADLEKDKILEKSVLDLYPSLDFHRAYFGEVLAAFEE